MCYFFTIINLNVVSPSKLPMLTGKYVIFLQLVNLLPMLSGKCVKMSQNDMLNVVSARNWQKLSGKCVRLLQ